MAILKLRRSAADNRGMKNRKTSSLRAWLSATNHQYGFTLVELLVTISIATILLTMAVPSFSDFVKDNRMVTQTNDFVTALNLARSEAIRRGSRVTVCKSSSGTACTAGGNWEQGWIVFVDADGDGAVNTAATDVLRVRAALATGVTLKGATVLANYISYVSSGATQQLAGGSAATQVGSLVMCDDRGFGARARAIQISPTGRISSTAGNATGSGASSCSP